MIQQVNEEMAKIYAIFEHCRIRKIAACECAGNARYAG